MWHSLLLLPCLWRLLSAFDPTPTDINKKCFTCSVFTFIDNKLLCANPGVCYSDYCYAYLLSDERSMYLSGCAEDVVDYPFRQSDERTLCHSRGPFGLCVCETGKTACNLGNVTMLEWIDSDMMHMNAVSNRVTGFSADYAKSRVQQLRVDGYPDTFEGKPLNSGYGLTITPLLYLITRLLV